MNKRVTLLTLWIAMILPLVLHAAEARRAVLLTDGSIVVGVVLERSDDGLVLRDDEGDVWDLPMEDIVEVRVVETKASDQEEWADEGFSGQDLYGDDAS